MEVGTSPGGHHVLRTVNQCSPERWLPRAAGEVDLIAAVTLLCDSPCHSCRVLQKAAYLSSPPQLLAAFEKSMDLLSMLSSPLQMSPRCASLALKHYLLKPVQRIPQYRLLLTGGLPNLTSQLTLTALIEYAFPKHAASHSPRSAA